MDAFWEGFEKQAGFWKSLGNVTGVRQLATGIRSVAHLHDRGKIAPITGGFGLAVKPGYYKRVAATENNLRSGALKALGTTGVLGVGAYGAKKMLSGSPQQK